MNFHSDYEDKNQEQIQHFKGPVCHQNEMPNEQQIKQYNTTQEFKNIIMEADQEDSQGYVSKNSLIKRTHDSESPDYRFYKESIQKDLQQALTPQNAKIQINSPDSEILYTSKSPQMPPLDIEGLNSAVIHNLDQNSQKPNLVKNGAQDQIFGPQSENGSPYLLESPALDNHDQLLEQIGLANQSNSLNKIRNLSETKRKDQNLNTEKEEFYSYKLSTPNQYENLEEYDLEGPGLEQDNEILQKEAPILQINIQMREQTEVIDVFEGQQPRQVALDFVRKYPELMNQHAIEILTNQISDKLKEIEARNILTKNQEQISKKTMGSAEQ